MPWWSSDQSYDLLVVYLWREAGLIRVWPRLNALRGAPGCCGSGSGGQIELALSIVSLQNAVFHYSDQALLSVCGLPVDCTVVGGVRDCTADPQFGLARVCTEPFGQLHTQPIGTLTY